MSAVLQRVAEPLCLCVDGSQLPSSRGCSLSQGGELPGSPVCTAGPGSELGRTRGKAFSLLWPRESKETYETTVTTELFWQCGDTAQPGPTPFPFPWVVVSIPVSQPWFSRLPQEVYPLLNGFCLKMFFLVPFCKWHNYKWYRRKWRDGKELLPADSPVTKVNSALMKLLRGSSGHEKLAISFFLNQHFNPNHIFLEIELKCFSILFFLGWLYQISYFAVLFSASFSHCLLYSRVLQQPGLEGTSKKIIWPNLSNRAHQE